VHVSGLIPREIAREKQELRVVLAVVVMVVVVVVPGLK
jgi:hypothetical protein